MFYQNTTLDKFITKDILKSNDIYDILNNCGDNQSEKGFVFERLFDLCIKFGCCDLFLNKDYYHILGNVNKGNVKEMNSIKKYILENKVISGNSGGCSDITLKNKKTDEFIFMTSKYPKDEEDEKKSKSVDYYDVQNIVSMRDHKKEIYKKYDIYTLVPNKEKVLKRVKKSNSSSVYITKYMSEDKILDEKDLNKMFIKLKELLSKYSIDEYDEVFLNEKQNLKHPFHQRLIIRKSSQLVASGNKTILWGCKPRSGKTYMAGGFILDQSALYSKYNVLIITPAPTETSPQFTEDLFHKYRDFDKFKITHFEKGNQKENFKFGNKNIIVVSKQLLQKYIGDDTIKEIKNLNLNAIIFDENHYGGTTDKSEEILSSYVSQHTVKIYLTATYNKPLQKWKISQDCQIFWDIEDEQLCKNKNWDGLIEKHGDIVNNVMENMISEGYSDDEILEEYKKYPELNILTTMFDPQRWEIIKESIMESKYGFSMDTLFSLSKKKKFNYPEEVKIVLRYISGDKKEEVFKNGDLSMYTRIKNICNDKESRKPFTQLWFLPVNGINDISKNLKEIMQEDDVLNKYDIFNVNSKSEELVDKVKDEVNQKEIVAKANKKRGLIILAGNMLTLGITLPLCDAVFMMNDTLSSDKVMQMMYRCMTESKQCDKKCGFVVDLKISRVLQACVSYNVHKKMHNTEEKLKFLIEHYLINIDSDYLKGKNIDSDKIVSKLMDIWKSDPVNNLNVLLKQIEDDIIEMENDDQKALNKYFSKSVGDNKVKTEIEIKDDKDKKQDIKNGKEKKKEDSDASLENTNESDTESKKDDKISLTKDVLPFAIPLACALTLNDNNNDFIEMLDTISKNEELLEVFNEQSFIWWNNKDIINLIKILTSKYVEKNSNTFNIAIIIKMTLKSLIDKPKKLLEFISERLKPKEKEKKQFGEVFTPLTLINQKLDKLDECYKKNNKNKSIFENKDLVWGDIAGSGMGNYSICVYLRLMEGLTEIIPNKKERKKYILENMLYMCEMNRKNVYICKQIFDINNDYKLNIHCGDGLKLDIKKKWNLDGFDIIIGNPPYNKDNTGTGNSIWQFFVKKNIDDLNKKGYLVFVHPSTWRKPQSEKSKMKDYFKLMCYENKMLYLEIHDAKDGIKTFGCSTRYDYYILQKEKNNNIETIINDEKRNINNIKLLQYEWLPNYKFDDFKKLFHNNTEPSCELLFDCNMYETRRKWVSKKESKEYKYKLINAITKNEIKYYYTNDNTKGMFGIKKVIFGTAGINEPLNDVNGEYGMTEHAMAIKYQTKNEGENIVKCLKSDSFKKLIDACNWSSFLLDWRLFTYFKKDFYKEFLKEKNKTNNTNNKNISDGDLSESDDDNKKKVVKNVKKINKDTKKKTVIESDSDSEFTDSEDEKPKKKNTKKK